MNVLLAITPFFLLILLGFGLSKLKIATDHWEKSFNQFSLKIGFPALIFYHLSKTPIDLEQKSALLLENSIFILATILISWGIGLLLRLSKPMANTLIICLPFGNIAFLGIPIGTELLGSGHITDLALIAGTYLFWVFIVALPLVQWNSERSLSSLLKVITNPLLIATCLGLLFSVSDIPIPNVVSRALELVANSVTALVLLAIGIFMATKKIGDFKNPVPALILTLTILIGLPLLLQAVSLVIGYDLYSDTKLISMMPLAVTPFALADKYELDKLTISSSIVLSTLLLPLSLSILY